MVGNMTLNYPQTKRGVKATKFTLNVNPYKQVFFPFKVIAVGQRIPIELTNHCKKVCEIVFHLSISTCFPTHYHSRAQHSPPSHVQVVFEKRN